MLVHAPKVLGSEVSSRESKQRKSDEPTDFVVKQPVSTMIKRSFGGRSECANPNVDLWQPGVLTLMSA